MKHLITLLSILLLSAVANAQNVVPNFSFEESDSCPTNFNNRTFEYSLGCIGWGEATSGTADYYNACDTAAASIGSIFPKVGVPYNSTGHQTAYEGKAYTGITMYTLSIPSYKEYLITSIPALEIDTTYKVTIHVSLADYCEYATDAMAVLFTTYGSASPYSDTTIIKTPQIDYTTYGVISDTANWTTLSGIFIADSAYTSLIIGGFKRSSEMNISIVNSNPKSEPPYISYYYIDNVIVEKFSSATGLASINNNNNAEVYPNPFTDHATFFFVNSGYQNNTLSIFNIQGQAVQVITNIVSDRVRIERNNLASGLYYYQLRNENNIVAYGKLIIR